MPGRMGLRGGGCCPSKGGISPGSAANSVRLEVAPGSGAPKLRTKATSLGQRHQREQRAQLQAEMAAGIELRRHLRRCSDPRWDCGGFDAFVAHAAPFVTLGYLRELVAGAPFVELPTTPESELVRMLPEEAGIAGVAVYAILCATFGQKRLDPHAELRGLVNLFDELFEGKLPPHDSTLP